MQTLVRKLRGVLAIVLVIGMLVAGGDVALVSASPAPAPTAITLSAGDVAIVGFNYDDPDEFAFVALTDIPTGTQIKFTDNGWTAAGAFRPGEGIQAWTAATDLCAGTVVKPGVGTMLFSASGDQILAYQGADASPTFLYALNSEGTGWQTDATNSNTSALPTGLVNGTTAVAIDEIDNGIYAGTTTGTKAALLSAISNKANWSVNDTVRFAMPTGPFAVSDAQPCADSAPFISSTTPTNGASGVSVSAAVNVTFSEPVNFSGPISIACTSGTQSGITPSGGPTTWGLAHTDFAPGDSCSITIPASQVSDVDTNDPPDNMAGPYTWSFTVSAPCGGPATLIHAIQGSGASSPLPNGTSVTVEGLVVGDFQASAQLRGFFVQEESADFDGDPATSEGIFVFEGASSSLNVAVGDKVRLSGTISEYGDRTVGTDTLTELSSLSLLQTCTSGNAVTPVSVTLPETVNGDLERFEGMLVNIVSPMTISQNYFVGRYGQMTLSSNGRMYQSTNVYDPGSPAQIALADENARRALILDDGKAGVRCGDNPNPVPYLGGPPPAVIRAGDGVSSLVGVLDYGQINSGSTGACNDGTTLFAGDFRLHPTQAPVFTPTNPRPSTPPAVGGTLRVASANLLNYFNTFGNGNCTNGVGGIATDCRGADTQTEFDRQADKLVLAIKANGADVIGFMEMENDGYGPTSAVQNLVGRLNTAIPGTYAFINPDTTLGTNSLGIDAIKVGVIYKLARVTPVGTAVLNSAAFTDPASSGTQKSRPALSQTFEDTTWGERFTVVVNHLKSKGSNCSPSSIPNDDDPVQGNCNGTRTAGAAFEVAWLGTTVIPSSGDTDLLVMGDMNAYAKEDPIDQFVNGGYTNMLEQYAGSSAYSYIFDGQSGNLDHALVSPGLASRVTGAGEWHINADEPAVIDYNTDFNPPGYYTADQYRSSDHDPLVIGLDLNPDQSDLASGYGLAWHTDGGKLRLGALWTGEASNTPGGDTGDDGVTIDTSNWRRGGTTAATAIVTRIMGSGNAWLAGWADWNNNGSFADPGELIVNGSVTVGSNTFSNIPIPVDAVVGYPVNMRFRLYNSLTEPAGLAPLAVSPSGRGNGGEVEDQSIQSIPLAVLLAGFNATPQGDAVLVTWETVSELNNQGFNLYRGGSPTAPETLLGYVPSHAPGSGAGASYQWLDEGLAAGQTVYYWLEAVDLSGATTLHGPVSATIQAPTVVTLSGLEADSRPGISARWIGAALFLVIGLASVVLTAERRQRRVR